MHRLLFILLCLSGTLAMRSQDPPQYNRRGQPFIQALYHQGVHWNRTRYMQEIMDGGYRSVDLRFGFQSLGGELWQQEHNYPRYGVGFNFADEILGGGDTTLSNPYSLYAFYSTPIFRKGRFSLNLHGSVGLSYMALKYDPVSNPYNDVVASHINLFFNLNFDLMVQLSQRLDLVMGYGMGHYSNGNIHEPQKGLNNWGWGAGLTYFIDRKTQPFQRAEFVVNEIPEFKAFEELQLMFAVGITEWQPDDWEYGKHHFASTFSTDYAWHLSRKTAVTFGIDVMYDGSLVYVLKRPPEQTTTFQKMYLGSHLGTQYHIKKITLLFNLGTYFYQTAWNRRWFYARAGARFRIIGPLDFHLAIKTRDGIRSDWIEWGLAYSIKTR